MILIPHRRRVAFSRTSLSTSFCLCSNPSLSIYFCLVCSSACLSLYLFHDADVPCASATSVQHSVSQRHNRAPIPSGRHLQYRGNEGKERMGESTPATTFPIEMIFGWTRLLNQSTRLCKRTCDPSFLLAGESTPVSRMGTDERATSASLSLALSSLLYL